ncbi:DNA adenine methylase [Bacteroides intestinalis]|jgi:DNA adenine methylase|uniref:Site-specific DNA-methyltransferase (adenine-specific) n=1 Tax=Bacteroides intestinalis TaxID=329854 RepID=A0AB37M3F3_9BACE|nr:Dam family site-specific DNA-(adenine-N6)-methyltransferase [Bacteroides intestinalis]RGK21357.1 Dam family site-specific DNA-(adenine-N6)-methyltransferase [Bacteroides intestinalis]RHN02089.1 Dam family site-specific DNA-(adenine-N6)-methyltransferase [Bacteroides intestinalis]
MQNDNILEIETTIEKPFLRWAGGKRWLIKHLPGLLPKQFNDYHEPFLGGASIFLYLKSCNLIQNHSFLSDFNSDLINVYKQLQNNSQEIINLLKTYKNERDFYYSIRAVRPQNEIEKAAIFIYLNRTSYNGIYRVNRDGLYNVPFGYRNGKNLLDCSNFSRISDLLSQNVTFQASDFEIVRENIKPYDLVFLDPPYTVAHENNGFIQYNQQIFSWDDQKRLADLLKFISTSNAYFILTNAAHVSIAELFNGLGNLHVVQRPSTIGGKGAKRTKVNEYVFTNVIL